MSGLSALVTGISGFAGSHLAEHLLEQGLEIAGTRQQGTLTETVARYCRTFALDLRDAEELRRVVRVVGPRLIFHLAGRTSDAESFRDPVETLSVNFLSTVNLLEAARSLEDGCRVLLVGSSAVYGCVLEDQQPIDEATPHRPLSPYGTSKAAQDLLGRQYFDAYGLDIIRAIPFNHTGPRQRSDAALPAFARQIAAAESGLGSPTIQVGDLSARRDVLDVRDVVRAYALLAEHGKSGEAYNVCAGRGYAVDELLQGLLRLSRGPAITARVDPARVRPASIPSQVGSSARLRSTTGWMPRIPIEETLHDLLEYWRLMER